MLALAQERSEFADDAQTRGAGQVATRGPFRVACVVAVVFFVLITLLLSVPLLSVGAREVISDVGLMPVAALVPVTCLWAARRSHGALRLGGALLGSAGILWTLGEVGWFVAHYLWSDAGASVADVFYLAAVVPAAAALVVLPPKGAEGRARVISLLGCLVAGGSVLFVAWSIILRTPLPTEAPPELAVLTAYPVADVVLLALALSAVIRSGNQVRPPMRLVAAGVATYAVADTVYSIQSSLDLYTAGSPVDLGWFAGYLLIALAALHPVTGTQRAQVPGLQHGGLASLLGYIPIAVATLVAASPRRCHPQNPIRS